MCVKPSHHFAFQRQQNWNLFHVRHFFPNKFTHRFLRLCCMYGLRSWVCWSQIKFQGTQNPCGIFFSTNCIWDCISSDQLHCAFSQRQYDLNVNLMDWISQAGPDKPTCAHKAPLACKRIQQGNGVRLESTLPETRNWNSLPLPARAWPLPFSLGFFPIATVGCRGHPLMCPSDYVANHAPGFWWLIL